MTFMQFPAEIRCPKAPPIKSQGIKTRLVPFILRSFRWDGGGRWIEPFVGSGAVLFNAAPEHALATDSNRHLIAFYLAVQAGRLTAKDVRDFLENEGALLEKHGETHYYAIRTRFNETGDSLDFLFLSRACFNGVMRFNSKGGFNVPFCRKPHRFRQAYVTKICNQISWIASIIRRNDWTFACQDWRKTLAQSQSNDFAYVDPPYVGRHNDYYNKWNEDSASELAMTLRSLPCGFAYSMWYRNKYRENEHLFKWFSDYAIKTKQHFYHVGSTEDLRNAMEEALVITPRYAVVTEGEIELPKASQLELLS